MLDAEKMQDRNKKLAFLRVVYYDAIKENFALWGRLGLDPGTACQRAKPGGPVRPGAASLSGTLHFKEARPPAPLVGEEPLLIAFCEKRERNPRVSLSFSILGFLIEDRKRERMRKHECKRNLRRH